MSLATLIRNMAAAGATPEAIALAVEAIEAAEAKVEARRASARERKRRQRAGQSRDSHGTVTPLSRDPSLEEKGFPEPLPKTQTLPPPSPPKGGSSPTTNELADQLWALQPKKHRRSTRPDTRKALAAALKRGGDPGEILSSSAAYYGRADCTVEDGRFAMGAARLLAEDRWRDFLPSPEPPPVPADAAVMAAREQHFRQTGEWRPAWGERPETQAA